MMYLASHIAAAIFNLGGIALICLIVGFSWTDAAIGWMAFWIICWDGRAIYRFTLDQPRNEES